jgi:hypothetical protein|tara:strand:- start:421 stop:747 length:327 start_codon:yes stop_codon:yes gene_type:complete
MSNKKLQLHEKTGIQFSLSFLVQVLATVVLAVWGYSQLDARISSVHNSVVMHNEKLNAIETDLKENQDKPIPSDHVQNTTLFAHERELRELKTRLGVLESRLYDEKNN